MQLNHPFCDCVTTIFYSKNGLIAIFLLKIFIVVYSHPNEYFTTENYKYYNLEQIKNKHGKLIEYQIVESKKSKNNTNMVFIKTNGTYSGTDLIKYPFKIIHYELGIKCRFYDLRGSFATTTLRSGVEIKDISKVLGHSKIETTENYYITSTIDTLKNVSETFEKEIDLNNFIGINCKKQ